jgi:steroid delta-isomerase-like uncharacterized protein
MIENNKALALRWIDDLCTQRNLKAADEIFAVDMVDHNPSPGQPAGAEGQKKVMRDIWAAFPDFHSEATQVIAEADRVVVFWKATGHHQGDYYGLPPSGKPFVWSGIDIVRVENGKIVERWGLSDDLSLLQQLGGLPSPGA